MGLETLRSELRPNLLIVCLHTDDGLVGLGETFYGAGAVEAYLHDIAAPRLFAAEAVAPESLCNLLMPYVGYQGSGVEARGNSAVDIALWDLLGKATDQPVSVLLGGPVRDGIETYNTCAGNDYVREAKGQSVDNWGLGTISEYEDLEAFLARPEELVASVREMGFGGLKVWPFDRAAERTGGLWIDPAELAFGIDVVERLRVAAGDDLRLMVELHGLWTPSTARRILRALEPYDLTWAEDPLRPDNPAALSELARSTTVPLAAGETLGGRRAYMPLLEAGALDVLVIDIGWTGGLTEARKIAAMAEAYGVPVAPHDCTGPLALAAGTHLSVSQPNALVQEVTRAFYYGWYLDVVEALPPLDGGRIRPLPGAGLGMELRQPFRDAPTTAARMSRAA